MFALTTITSVVIQYTITITHMFELSELKAKKLAELQEIAKELGIKKITGLKKIELTYRIIDHQSTLPDEGEKKEEENAPANPAVVNNKKPARDKKDNQVAKENKQVHKNDRNPDHTGYKQKHNKGNNITKKIVTKMETMPMKKGTIIKIIVTAIANPNMSLRVL